MRDAEEWARIWNATATLPSVPRELAELITAARREGAEDMRARARKMAKVFSSDAADMIDALPLPGDTD